MPKPPPPNDECYYAEDSYAVNEQTGGFFDQVPKALIRRIGAKVKGTKVGSMMTITVRVIMFEKEITTATTTSKGVTMVIETIGMGPMFLLKIMKLLLGMVEVV